MDTLTLDPAKSVIVEDEHKTKTLVLADRCDSCGAQAFMYAYRDNEAGERSDLLFCGHHGSKFLVGLIGQGFAVEDSRNRINAKNESSF